MPADQSPMPPRGSTARRPPVHGPTVDEQTRCIHYSSEVDIVAIKLACCERYFPCIHCHAEIADHDIATWQRDQFQERAILCGACGDELTIAAYRATDRCPSCRAPFNPRCRLHHHLYFDVPAARGTADESEPTGTPPAIPQTT